MPNNNTIGEAYIQIKPSTEGISGELQKAMGDAGESGSSSFGSAFASGIKKIGAVSSAVIGAAASGVTALTKSAVSAFGDYQQLEGGVQTLFGTGGKTLEEFAETAKVTAKEIENSGVDWEKYADTAWMTQGGGISGLLEELQWNIDELKTSSEELEDYLHFEYDLDLEDAKMAIKAYQDAMTDESIQAKFDTQMQAQALVMENASKAYESAGISANKYMENVTSFAASLKQSTSDEVEAAKIADMAIIDMADNANKMGTSMESIQTAYQGFAKQNYTMLDNLKLGYGGTKEEMARLLADATAISGIEYDMDSLADVYNAIHVIQDELGIAGTTSDEAATTIQGSLGMLSASWSNLVAGIANPDMDLGVLIDNVVTSASTALDNLSPVIERALVGIGDAITQITPIIAEMLPGLIDSLLPPLLDAAITLVHALVEALPTILSILIEEIPKVIDLIVETVLTMLPVIIDLGLQLILALADGIIENLDDLIPAIVDVVFTIVDKLTDPDALSKLIEASLEIIVALASGLVDALPRLIEKVPVIISNIVQTFITNAPKLLVAAGEIIGQLVMGFIKSIPSIVKAIGDISATIIEFFDKLPEMAIEWGMDLLAGFIEGIMSKISGLRDTVSNIANTVKDFLGFSEPEMGPLSNFHTFAPDMMNLFASGIRSNIGTIEDAVGMVADAVAGEMQSDVVVNSSMDRSVATSDAETYAQMALASGMGGDITIPVYIGGELIDRIVVNAQTRANYRSGGR